MLRKSVGVDPEQAVPGGEWGPADLSVVWIEADEEVGKPDRPTDTEYEEWYRAYLIRAERNQRFHCSYCGAFITKAQADASWRWTDYGKEWEPECPPGKGCGRVRSDA